MKPTASTFASPSTRRAWIEIAMVFAKSASDAVALHPEGVDRNTNGNPYYSLEDVALHPEGVDRNAFVADLPRRKVGSPSIRRAWIEIWETYWQTEQGWVTLHPKGVDRNTLEVSPHVILSRSPSTRRAWVERKS